MVSRQTKDERTPFSPYANHDHISAKAQVVKEGYRRERFSTVILNGVSHVVILEGASRPIDNLKRRVCPKANVAGPLADL